MRLHRLEITAFGPFADRQSVDFDRLSEAGLFLLHGPTGAGKTSVLDAVCFALYGRVPGARGVAGRLRSDHAGPSIAPEVVCEFSVGGRRLEVTRRAEWHRPKKRGTGTVREQSRVALRELTGSGWRALTGRIDEAAEELQQLIGLGPEQFTKLVLLPQGDFAAFLRATPEERRPLLQRLFGTDRFTEVERWLAERRRDTEQRVRAARATTALLLARAEESRIPEADAEADADAGAESDAAGAESAAADEDPDADAGAVAARVRRWAAEAAAARDRADTGAAAAGAAHDAARRAHDAAAAEVEAARRRAELAARLDDLLAGADEHARRVAAADAAERAAALVPLLADRDDARGEVDTARRAARAAGLAARAAGEPEGDAARLDALRSETGTLATLLEAHDDLRRLRSREAAADAAIAEAGRERAAADDRARALAAEAEQLAAERAAAELLAVTAADRERDAGRARAVTQAVLEAERARADRDAAADALRAAVDEHQQAVGAALDLRARRLDGMAAELAAALTDGRPCPVCGAAEHPAPAVAGGAAVTEAAQQEVERAVTRSEARRERARTDLAAVERRLAELTAVSGPADAASAAAVLRAADEAAAAARAAADRLPDLAARGRRVAARRQQCADRARVAAEGEARAREELAEVTGRREELARRLDAARGDDPDVPTRLTRLTAATDALAAGLAARQALTRAGERADRADRAVRSAAAAAGFADPGAAVAAVLPEAARRRLRDRVTGWEAEVQRVRARLDELTGPTPAPTADGEAATPTDPADPGDPGDLTRLADDLERAAAADRRAAGRQALAARSARALGSLAVDLDRHARESRPLADHFATLEALSRCVEGTGGDNALRMRLSSYVLAARLEQVAAAASARLGAMSGGRYTLVHTDGPTRAGARSGLGLAVVDGWTGAQRDPASLSGGETFCTSLALALGLADVVQAEAGGAVIETLLVDEGFGGLDEETLDEVMDVLDGLRAAGRAVGLVSHVPDLRHRIPARLEVVKGRTGSRLVA